MSDSERTRMFETLAYYILEGKQEEADAFLDSIPREEGEGHE